MVDNAGFETGVVRLSSAVAVAEFVRQAGGPTGFAESVQRTFTADELEALSQRSVSLEGRVARTLAKQLVCELLNRQPSAQRGSGRGQVPRVASANRVAEHEVEILTSPSGRPTVSGACVSEALSRRLHVSMSHDGGMAAALVVCESEQAENAGSAGSEPESGSVV